jgi:hypothetical protein
MAKQATKSPRQAYSPRLSVESYSVLREQEENITLWIAPFSTVYPTAYFLTEVEARKVGEEALHVMVDLGKFFFHWQLVDSITGIFRKTPNAFCQRALTSDARSTTVTSHKYSISTKTSSNLQSER